MPAHTLEPGMLENLLATQAETLRLIRTATAYLDSMDQTSRLVQATKLELSQAEGHATAAIRQSRNLRALVLAANQATSRRNGHTPAPDTERTSI